MIEVPKTEKAGLLKSLEPLLEPIFEYGRSLRLWYNATQLADRIRDNEIDTVDVSKLAVAATVIGFLVAKIVPDESPGGHPEIFNLPLIDEAVMALILLVAGVVVAVIVYWP